MCMCISTLALQKRDGTGRVRVLTYQDLAELRSSLFGGGGVLR